MDHQIFQALAIVFGLMVSIIGTLVMLVVRSQQRTLEKHEERTDALFDKLNSLANEVAKNYMPRSELEKKLDSIFELLEDIRKEVRHA
jgi:uncharacterized membrane-anchored protein YhcB (DUF1043 family)